MIRIANFQGEIPRRHPRLLPQGFAAAARNCKLESGSLLPMREPSVVHTFGSTVKSIARHASTWYGWASPGVSAQPGPVATDRLYITGDAAPKLISTGNPIRDLALHAPSNALTMAVTGGSVDPDMIESVTYAYTWVTDLDEESGPSPFATPMDWSPGLDVTLSGFGTPTSGRGIDRVRIYRSQTSMQGVTEMYFVAEKTLPVTTVTHDLATDPIQELIPTAHFDTPPTGLSGLVSMPNGMMAAFDRNEVHFCEPYQPHAWPRAYSLAVDYEVVALVAIGSSLAILTEGTPYIAQGTAPANMVLDKVEENLPCVAAASVVDLGYAGIYASTEGFVTISTSGARVITRGLFSSEDWEHITPTSIVGGRHFGRYVFGYAPGGGARQLGIIDLSGEQPFFFTADTAATDMVSDLEGGALYMQTSNTQIKRFDPPGGNRMTQKWKSQIFHLASPTNYSAILIQGEITDTPASTTVKVYADGALKATVTSLNQITRLPSGFLAREWQIEISGNTNIASVSMGESISQLRSVS